MSNLVDNIFDTELYFTITPERRLFLLFSNMIKKVDDISFPNRIFWFKNDKLILQYNEWNEILWVRYDLIYLIIESEFKLTKRQIKRLIKNIVKNTVKIEFIRIELMADTTKGVNRYSSYAAEQTERLFKSVNNAN